MSEPEASDNEPMTYEAALARLKEIVAELDGGTVGVDDLEGRVTEATRLITLCRDKLTGSQLAVEHALAGLSGQVGNDSSAVVAPSEAADIRTS